MDVSVAAEYQKNMLQRTALCFEQDALTRIYSSLVAIAGLGAVGAITVELFARWGVKKFHLLDKDKYEASNLKHYRLKAGRFLGD